MVGKVFESQNHFIVMTYDPSNEPDALRNREMKIICEFLRKNESRD
jgi:hypothetical protein